MPIDNRENVLDFNGGRLTQRGLFYMLCMIADHGSVVIKNVCGYDGERTFTDWKAVLKLDRDAAN